MDGVHGHSVDQQGDEALCPALAFAIELEPAGIKVNAITPGFIKTNLNGYEGTGTLEEGAREAVRVALSDADGPTGAFTGWEHAAVPW